MAYDTVLLEHAGGVSTLTLNRPPVNAVSPALMQDVLGALEALEARDATRCIVVTERVLGGRRPVGGPARRRRGGALP
jgi:enoyl-CoA hydratase/carnithine racemase